MQQTTGSDFSTRDFNLASFFLAIEKPFRRLNGPQGQRAFVFGNVTDDDVASFYAGVKVDARKLLNAVRDLKALLHQGDRR